MFDYYIIYNTLTKIQFDTPIITPSIYYLNFPQLNNIL